MENNEKIRDIEYDFEKFAKELYKIQMRNKVIKSLERIFMSGKSSGRQMNDVKNQNKFDQQITEEMTSTSLKTRPKKIRAVKEKDNIQSNTSQVSKQNVRVIKSKRKLNFSDDIQIKSEPED